MRMTLLIAALVWAGNAVAATDFRVGVWGNSPGNEASAVNFHRYGCKGVYERCKGRFESYGNIPSMGIAFFSPDLSISQLIDTAKKYSLLSKSHSNIQEVSADDFVDFLKKSKSMNDEKNMLEVISAIKSANKDLRFAVTLYENEISEVTGALAGASPSVRSKVDRVAFYLRFRESVNNLDDYVAQVKSAFPNAQIDIGLYNYDRTGRLACARGRIQCSHQNDVALLKQQLVAVERLKQKGAIQGVEIYPGEVGKFQRWAGWKNENICPKSKLNACIKNSDDLTGLIFNPQFLSKLVN